MNHLYDTTSHITESLNVYKSAEYGNISLLKLLLWHKFSY